jgi:DNA polymerase I-like protein with 3'-5' exonuclease and polymerase domains
MSNNEENLVENVEEAQENLDTTEYTEENQGTLFEYKDTKEFEWPAWIKEASYILVDTKDKFDILIQEVSKASVIAFDIETTGLHLFKDKVVGVSVSTIEGSGYYLPIKHLEGVNLPESYLIELLKYVTDSTKKCLLYNAKFDRSFILEEYGIDINNYFDVMASSYVFDPVKKSQSLKNSGKLYLNLDTVELGDLFPKKKKKKGQPEVDKNFAKLDQSKWFKYACQDADLTLRLYTYLGQKIKDNAAKYKHLDKLPSIVILESRLASTVQKMERRGVELNEDRVRYLYTSLNERMAEIRLKIEKTIPKHFIKEDIETFLNSPDQIGKFVYGDQDSGGLGIVPEKLTKGGKASTDAEAFEKLGKKDNIPKKSKAALTAILGYRELAKSFNTYVWNLHNVLEKGSNIAYFGFMSMKTETARFAGSGGSGKDQYCGINIQAYPKHEDNKVIMAKKLKSFDEVSKPFEKRQIESKDLFIDVDSIKKILPEFDKQNPVVNYYGQKYCLLKSCSGCELSKWCSYTHELIDITETNPEIVNYRAILKARPGFKIGSFDYANEELRIAANISGEDYWIDAFNKGRDLHFEMAKKLYKLPDDAKVDDHKGLRKIAKSINFAIPYGGGPNRISIAAGIDIKEAKRIYEEYKKSVPKVFQWIKDQHSSVRKIEGALTAFGRYRAIPGIRSEDKGQVAHAERLATNTPIQATASDIMKLTMIQLDKAIKNHGYQDDLFILLTVHDELVFEMRESKLDELVKFIEDTMTFSIEKLSKLGIHWKVPITADGDIGDSWGIKLSYDKYKKVWAEVAKIEQDLQYIREGKEIPVMKDVVVIETPKVEVVKELPKIETVKELPKVVETPIIKDVVEKHEAPIEIPHKQVVFSEPSVNIGHIVYDELQFSKMTENCILYDINALDVCDTDEEKVEIVLHALKDPKARGDKEVIFIYAVDDKKYAIQTGIKVKNEQTVRLAVNKAKHNI